MGPHTCPLSTFYSASMDDRSLKSTVHAFKLFVCLTQFISKFQKSFVSFINAFFLELKNPSVHISFLAGSQKFGSGVTLGCDGNTVLYDCLHSNFLNF